MQDASRRLHAGKKKRGEHSSKISRPLHAMVASADAGESLTATLVGVQSCSQNMIGFLDHMAYMADDQRVRVMCDRQVLVWIIQRRQEMQHRVDPRAFLVVRFHH